MALSRRFRWIALAILSPFILLLAIQFTLPLWLDQAAVKREITRIIATATGGRAEYAGISLRFLPWPRAVISEVRFSLPGTVDVTAHRAEIDIRLLPLLRGRVEPRRLHIASPSVTLHLPKSAPDTTASPPFSLKGADAKLHTALAMIEQRAPGFAAEIENGHFVLDAAGRAPLVLEQVQVSADISAGDVEASVALTAPWVQRLRANVRLAPSDLGGKVDVTVTALDAASLGAALGADSSWPVSHSMVNADLAVRMRGLSDAQLSLTVVSPQVALRIPPGSLDLRGLDLEATARTTNGAAEVTVKKLALSMPHLEASATLTRSAAGAFALTAQTGDIDLAALQSDTRSLAPAVGWLDSLPVRISRGTLANAKLVTEARTVADLFGLPAMHITGTLENAAVTVTVLNDLEVSGVNASASLDRGRLHAEGIALAVGKTTAHDGTFDMDLDPNVPTLGADIAAHADLADGFAAAGRILGADSAKTLGAISGLRGSADARVSLRGTVDSVIPRVDFSRLDAVAHYAAIPFPIRIAGGGGSYASQAVSVSGLAGTVGASAFHDLAARVALASPMVVTAQRGTVRLALAELFHWARTQPKLARQLDSVSAVSGALVVAIHDLSLKVDTPAKAAFRATATPEHLHADAPRFGPPAVLDGGAIEVTDRDISAAGVGLSVLDARLTVAGTVPHYRDSVSELSAGASGVVGPDALAWIWSRAKLPHALRLRGGLTLSAAAAEWSRGAGTSARGVVAIAGGPSVDFALRSEHDLLDIEHVTLRDAATDVRIVGRLDGDQFKAEYKGRLAGSTIDHIFVEAPVRLAELDGDLRASGNLRHSRATHATGTLTGSGIVLPASLPFPLTIERLSLEAKDSVLVLHTAALASGGSRATIAGQVSFVGDKFLVDATVRGDTVIIPPSEHRADSLAARDSARAEAPKPTRGEEQTALIKAIRDIPVEGSARVNIGLFRFGRFDVSPLQGSAVIEPRRIALTLDHTALCGIAVTGGVTFVADTFDLSASLAARDEPLAQQTACLTQQQVQMTGTVNVTASVKSRGPPGTLLDRAQGTFTLTATKGRISRFDQLSKVLKVVNSTQVLVGQAADLDKGGMAYSLAQIDLKIEGARIEVKQFTLDATGVDVGAHGHVDLAGRELDLDVLVAPIKTGNWIVSHTPIIRNIFGGTILAIPVHIGGTIEHPSVVPLGAKAVGSRLLDIMGNTLSLPKDLIKVPADSTKH